jgi:hypothetical protein
VALADSTTDTTFLLAVLGKVAKAIGKHYEKSQNETLQALTPNYNNMKEEAKYLSKLVEKNLQEYDKEIINSTAVLMDDLCTAVCSVICGLLSVPVCPAICGAICGLNPVCIPHVRSHVRRDGLRCAPWPVLRVAAKT